VTTKTTEGIDATTAKGVEALTKPGRHRASENLYLSVGPTGKKSWCFIYRFAGKTYEAGLGRHPIVSLKAARAKALEGQTMLAARPPINPLSIWRADKNAKKVPTFAEAAKAYIAAHQGSWRSETHRNQWLDTIDWYCGPIAGLKVDAITTDDVLKALRPIWNEKRETASRLRGRIERILAAAKALGHIDRNAPNPATWRGHLKELLPARKKSDRGHFKALDYADGPEFMRALRDRRWRPDGSIDVAVLGLEFCVLTAARTNEVMGAKWGEVDFDRRVWTVPAERTKREREFQIPLSDGAMAVLAEALKIRSDDLIFSRGDDRKLPPLAFLRTLNLMGIKATTHGMRSMFRDWAGNETPTPKDVCEQALGHAVGDQTEQAYRRQDALGKRRILMAQWDDFLSEAPKVISLKRA
jgi:integrase